jgi:hypothetical protein
MAHFACLIHEIPWLMSFVAKAMDDFELSSRPVSA